MGTYTYIKDDIAIQKASLVNKLSFICSTQYPINFFIKSSILESVT